jgi:hypothetical protein
MEAPFGKTGDTLNQIKNPLRLAMFVLITYFKFKFVGVIIFKDNSISSEVVANDGIGNSNSQKAKANSNKSGGSHFFVLEMVLLSTV